MKRYESPNRVRSSILKTVLAPTVCLLLVLLICVLEPADAQTTANPVSLGNPPLTTKQVVNNLVERNLERSQALHAYHGTRTYRVEYKGFPSNRSAEMVVDVIYQSPGTKKFTIQSSTGSRIIIDNVFKKLFEAEQEALAVQSQRRAALNTENYEFKMVGYERLASGPVYVLGVEPRTKDKFLYRGRIWVDAEDFAVVRLEAEPAKNPSFWTKNSQVEQVYSKTSAFWLPLRNRSITTIRLGGKAELTIQYNNYQITAADPVGSRSAVRSTESTDVSRAQRPGEHQ
jgi:outer membrane lipoprotein-sorting protein